MRWIFIALSCLLVVAGVSVRAQSPAMQQKAIVLKRMIELNHYSPRPVDDSFSVSVFKNILNAADPRRLLFTAGEYKELLAYSTKLDDELQGKSWGFLDLFTAKYKTALSRADSVVNNALQKPFDFSTNETITSSRGDSFLFAADRAALISRWSRYLKFMILNQVYDAATEDSAKQVPFKTALTTVEPAIREKIKQTELRNLKKITSYPAGTEAFSTELYLNAVAMCFDPHTNYFSPQGKEDFQAQLSTEAYSFGVDLDENDKGQIVIDKLIPGGPAWKTGELHKGDELISLQWEGKEAVEVTGSSLEDVNEIVEQSAHDRLVWKFRKADGTTTIVLMRKEKIDNEENIVKSFVLKGEKKIGYILLPGFYTEWENETGSSCANDVAKEIVKLKRENIDGLILDIRFNGGGSVAEAIDMIGIFIDEGPLAADKDKNGKLSTYKDPNRGTIYDGPLAVMVNGQSASASEIVAASLQDYNRALIIGSNTYGKATMQQMFSLDTMTSKPYTGAGDKDIVKITMRKLYRVNGQSAQLKGVTPDIVLPDAFDGIDFGERFEKNVLPSDTVKRNSYYKPLKPLPVSELARQSATRIAGSIDFANIKKIAEVQRKAWQETSRTIPLKWDSFEKWEQQHELDLKLMEGKGTETQTFTVENHAQDKQLLQNNPDAKETNRTWLENIADDIYIEEVFHVLTDLINLQKANR